MSRYTLETVHRCIRELSESRSFPEAIGRINGRISLDLNGDNLCKIFKRHGFNAPRKYLGVPLPPVPSGSGVSAFGSPLFCEHANEVPQRCPCPDGCYCKTHTCLSRPRDERTRVIASTVGVARPVQQPRSGQHAGKSEQVPTIFTGQERLTTILAVPDIHAPFHDRLAVATCVEAVRLLKPDHLVFLGDVVDSYDISDFPRDPGRKHKYKEELAEANAVLDMFDQLAVPDVRFCCGNHDFRLDKYIAKRAPELHGMLSIEDELHIEERCWQWIPYGEVTTIGKFHFSHEFGTCGKYAAATALAGTRHCIVFGHTHRAQCEYGGLADGERHVAWSSGWLGDYEALAFSYKRKWQARREWTHGFTWIVLDETGRGCSSFIPILDGRCIVEGQVISGRKAAA